MSLDDKLLDQIESMKNQLDTMRGQLEAMERHIRRRREEEAVQRNLEPDLSPLAGLEDKPINQAQESPSVPFIVLEFYPNPYAKGVNTTLQSTMNKIILGINSDEYPVEAMYMGHSGPDRFYAVHTADIVGLKRKLTALPTVHNASEEPVAANDKIYSFALRVIMVAPETTLRRRRW